MLELFQRQTVSHNIYSQKGFSLRSIDTSSYGLKSLKNLAPKIWNLVPEDMQFPNNLFQFIREIIYGCPCVLCRTYSGQVGYIN